MGSVFFSLSLLLTFPFFLVFITFNVFISPLNFLSHFFFLRAPFCVLLRSLLLRIPSQL